MTALARTLLLTLALILPAAAPATAADASADSADSADAAAAAPIGFIKTLSGEVHVDADADGRGTQRAHIGMAVHLGQTLRTAADASVGLILRDDTTLTLGPGSRLVIDRFLFAPADESLGLGARLYSGTMQFISGAIARLKPESVEIVTPRATIGVRGTRFLVKA